MTLATFGSYKAIAPEIIFIMYNDSVSESVNQQEKQLSKFYLEFKNVHIFLFCQILGAKFQFKQFYFQLTLSACN